MRLPSACISHLLGALMPSNESILHYKSNLRTSISTSVSRLDCLDYTGDRLNQSENQRKHDRYDSKPESIKLVAVAFVVEPLAEAVRLRSVKCLLKQCQTLLPVLIVVQIPRSVAGDAWLDIQVCPFPHKAIPSFAWRLREGEQECKSFSSLFWQSIRENVW